MRKLDEKSKHSACKQLAAEMDVDGDMQRQGPAPRSGPVPCSSGAHPKFLLPARAGRIKVDSAPRDKKRTEGMEGRSLEELAGPETLGDRASERTLHTSWAHHEGKWNTNQGEMGICQ